jgi:hypothetical protein
MAFTVHDFHDLVEILETQPSWRAELRRLVLTDEILNLPKEMRELAQIVRELAETSRRNEARFARIEGDIGTLKTDVAVLKTDVAVLKTDVAGLRGSDLEWKVRERPFVYFSRFARRLRVVDDAELGDLLEDAMEQGRITDAEADQVKLLDAVARGLDRTTNDPLYLVAEVSSVVHEYDLERVVARAELFHKATGLPVLPIVVGKIIRAELRAQVESLNAHWMQLPE